MPEGSAFPKRDLAPFPECGFGGGQGPLPHLLLATSFQTISKLDVQVEPFVKT